ncbi:hypothetical protein AVEN_193358-1 [Araneus ventricosus]|uniref:Secreted protein n=1 Tax=Araneus ventricosus TaxID=182803 RepID=A0A4Y2EPS7_ARAVE|nr:hypothetical protein AVEN_193358-1 [Araneus ventricosus]
MYILNSWSILFGFSFILTFGGEDSVLLTNTVRRKYWDFSNHFMVSMDSVRFPSREQRSHEKKSAGPFDIGGKQQELHLDIANKTEARERTSHRGPPQCGGIHHCQRTH